MKSKKVTRALFIIYLVFLAWIILFKMAFSLRDLPHLRNINLIPFAESVIVNGSLDVSEIINNALAFVPFGIFISVLWEKKSVVQKIIPIFLVSLLFEAAQFIFSIGASDVTDLLSNTLGGLTGIGITLVLSKVFKGNVTKVINVVCSVGAVFMLAFLSILILANL